MSSVQWESDRQRAVVYVERRRRERLALRDAIFRRINAHVTFTDHAHARRRQEEERTPHGDEIDMGFDPDSDDAPAEAAEEDLALDFLGDVNADDMRSLLADQAPAAMSATTASVASAAEAAEAIPPVVVAALAPLSMPMHLLSTANAATVNTTAMAGVSVGVSMGEDTGVSELMDELQIDVQSLAASTATTTATTAKIRPRDCGATANEQKTEESTPPRHVREQRAQCNDEDLVRDKLTSPSAKKAIGGAMETAWKDVFDPETAAADEMVTWVTGKNAPEVVKRLETLRGENKRKNTKRFGTNTYLEQATIRRVAKYHAGEGDGSSSSSSAEEKSDSDFEIIEVEEEEDEEEAVEDDESFSDTELREEERRRTPTAKRRIRQRPRTKMTIKKKSAPSTKASSPKTKRTTRIVLEESDDEEVPGRGDTAKSTERVRDEDEKEAPRPAEKTAPQNHEEPQAIDLISESEGEAEPDTHDDMNANTSDVKDKPMSESEKQSASAIETATTDVLKVPTASLQERIEDTRSEVSMVCEPAAETPEKTPVEPEHLTQPTDDAHGDHGYEVDESDYGSDDEAYSSDTGTIDLENEEMLARLAEESKGSPTSTTPSVANGVLNPVEPQVKMSPQHTTPPSSARALQPDSPTTPQKSDAAPADPDTVTFEDVSSDVDFGSGESADFGGDDDVAAVVAGGGDDDDEETEFTQFFVSNRGTQRSAKSSPSKPLSQTEVLPVQKVHAEEPPSASAPLVGNTKEQSLAASFVMVKGSNGLRAVPNINTTTVTKGRYKQTRKAIRLLDEDMNVTNPEPRVHDPKAAMIKRSRLVLPAAPPSLGEVSPTTIRPLHLRRSHSEDRGKAGVSERYLNYDRAGSQPRGPSIKETFVIAAKQARQRFDNKTGRSTPTSQTPLAASKPILIFETTAVGTGAGVLKPLEGSITSDGVYLPPRERQLDVYQATGAISQFDDDDAPLSLTMNHKRPIKFVKETEEAKRSGIDVRKGKPVELDPRAKIPKKSARQLAQERTTESERQASHAGKREGDKARRKDTKDSAVSPSKFKRAKTANAKAESNGASSKYGPSSGPPSSSSQSYDSNKRAKTSKHDTSSGRPSIYGPSSSSASSRDSSRQRKNDAARHHGSSSVGSKKRRRSPSPSHNSQRDRGRDRESSNRDERNRGSSRGARDDEWNRGRDRDRDGRRDYSRHERSRSPSDSRSRSRRSHSPPQNRSSRNSLHHRSRSRSRSPARVAPRDERRHRDDRQEDRRPHDRWSQDDPRRSAPSYVVVEDLARSMTSDHDGGKEPRMNPTPREDTTESGQNEKKAAVEAPIENEEGSDIEASDIEFIDDFDDEPGADIKPDIRVKLSDIKIDDELRARMVYVSNVPPQLDEEHITEMFRNYGIAKNHAMGIPAVEVFLCQRSHRPRGDARITFVTPEAAADAANDMNSHISGNTKVFVREMDKDTMRVLHAQFDTFRDTWICPNADCRAESSTWARLCSTCNHHRVFPPSNVKVHSGDWLCSICFATNAEMSSKCSCCGALLPLLPREKAFHKQTSTRRREHLYCD